MSSISSLSSNSWSDLREHRFFVGITRLVCSVYRSQAWKVTLNWKQKSLKTTAKNSWRCTTPNTTKWYADMPALTMCGHGGHRRQGRTTCPCDSWRKRIHQNQDRKEPETGSHALVSQWQIKPDSGGLSWVGTDRWRGQRRRVKLREAITRNSLWRKQPVRSRVEKTGRHHWDKFSK